MERGGWMEGKLWKRGRRGIQECKGREDCGRTTCIYGIKDKGEPKTAREGGWRGNDGGRSMEGEPRTGREK